MRFETQKETTCYGLGNHWETRAIIEITVSVLILSRLFVGESFWSLCNPNQNKCNRLQYS
jgi:hypothetical protein